MTYEVLQKENWIKQMLHGTYNSVDGSLHVAAGLDRELGEGDEELSCVQLLLQLLMLGFQ